ncbi:MAG: hypothetical protein GVY13_15595 [Alphaproteobacteria bacterium]|jgi:uncharacterized protein (DUF4415 family)|nr:hypothetical protein [Alphaproteobacteria bacterium]
MKPADDDIRTATDDEIETMERRGELHYDPKAPGFAVPEDFWDEARPVIRRDRATVRLELDPDVLAWFKDQGPGYKARMNEALRAWMNASKTGSER